MRGALDDTAQRNYNLQRDAAFDPLKYRMAQDATDTSALELGQNRKIYGDNIPYHAAQASLEGHQLGNAQIPANMGIYGPLYKHLGQNGAVISSGGVTYPNIGQDASGAPASYTDPMTGIGNRYQATNTLRSEYQQARIEAQVRGQDLSWEKFLESKGMGASSAPAPAGGYLGIPKATTTAPAVTAAGTPQQGINLNNPYGFHSPY